MHLFSPFTLYLLVKNFVKRNFFKMIYLDNSSSTFTKPKQVLKNVSLALSRYTANPGRSGHRLSIDAATMVTETRIKTSKMFNLGNENNVIFTSSCSAALNQAILGTAKMGGHVVCTENDHNSCLRPLEHLKQIGMIDYTVASQSCKGVLTREDIEKCLQPNTYMVIANHMSNVNGDMCDIEGVGKLCKERGLLFLVDAAQSGGHEIIDMQKDGIDFLTLAPHKGFYALQGLGVLLARKPELMQPITFGGTGTNSLELVQPLASPERFEVGTLPTPAIFGFSGGIDFVNENFSAIRDHLDDLTTFLHYEFSSLPVEIYTCVENSKGVFSFNIPSMHSTEVASYLDEKFGICVRGGYHCAAKKHEALGLLDQGAVRVSLSFFTSFSDVQKLVVAVKSLLKKQKINKK